MLIMAIHVMLIFYFRMAFYCRRGEEHNVVGRLQELTHKLHWPPPKYSFVENNSPPHRREYVCVACVLKVAERGMYKRCHRRLPVAANTRQLFHPKNCPKNCKICCLSFQLFTVCWFAVILIKNRKMFLQ